MGEGSKIPEVRPDDLTICDRAEAIRLVFQVLRKPRNRRGSGSLKRRVPLHWRGFQKNVPTALLGRTESSRGMASLIVTPVSDWCSRASSDSFHGSFLTSSHITRTGSSPRRIQRIGSYRLQLTTCYQSPGEDRTTRLIWSRHRSVRNEAKEWWTLEELGWKLHDPGSPADWDGLTTFFLEFVDGESVAVESKVSAAVASRGGGWKQGRYSIA